MTVTMPSCRYCGPFIVHSGACPKVKSVEYYPNGAVKSVELHEERHSWQR